MMENIYLAKINEDSTYTISRVGVNSKVEGTNGETVVFVYKSFEHMPNALGLVVFQPGTKSWFVNDNIGFFLDCKSAQEWVEEKLERTTFKTLDIDSTVYVVDEQFNIAKHTVISISKHHDSSNKLDKLAFIVNGYAYLFMVDGNDLNSSTVVETIDNNQFVLFSDIKEATKYTKFNIQRKIENLKKEYLAKMADYTDKLNKVETFAHNI